MNVLTSKPIKKKTHWLRWGLELLFILLLIFGLRAWQQRDLVSGTAPDFQSIMLNGHPVKLEDYHGKPFILHFWAEWCTFCKAEESSLTNIQKDWPLLSVAYQSGNQDKVSRYMTERNIDSWSTIVDQDNKIADLFAIKSVPTTYIIDGDGNIRFSEIGLTSEWGLRARLWWASKFQAN